MVLRKLKVLFGIIFIFYVVIILLKMNLTFSEISKVTNHCGVDIDVVITWVNGSEPDFKALIKYYRNRYDGPERFSDKNELKYLLRSIELYAPWVRHVYLVTNHIPYWLNLSYERISLVPHKLLAPNAEFLPTFSSVSIETFIHRIPNLSKRFLYLNDDIFLGAHLFPEDLYTDSEGVKIFLDGMVPDCTWNCSWSIIGDGTCDLHCNKSACQYDGGDCKNNDLQRQNVKTNVVTTAVKHFPVFTTQKKFHRLKKRSTNYYSLSLVFTNKLLNEIYGFKPRKVMAHVGFLIDHDIMEQMQAKFAKEIRLTASHRFRAQNDLQIAFAYYSFLMNEQISLSVEELFDEFDTDNSLSWSDREIRTFLTRIFPVVDDLVLNFFWEVIRNCSIIFSQETINPTLIRERHNNSYLPIVTRDLVNNCSLLDEAMLANLGTRPKYKYKINEQPHSNFIMLSSDIKKTISELDKIRRNPRKFNCINDNLTPRKFKDNAIIRSLLENFYLSMFPKPSKFELNGHKRNCYTTLEDYQRLHFWKPFFIVAGCSFTILIITRHIVLQKYYSNH